MRQAATTIVVRTSGRRLYEITDQVVGWCADRDCTTGLVTLFCRHTSASLLMQENAAPEVQQDLVAFFDRIAPEDRSLYAHDDEGPDDMPAHIKAALTQVSLTIPLLDGRPALGTWQGIYLFEHRHAPHRREVVVHLAGE